MKINFKNIVPHPLSDIEFDDNSVWNNNLIWQSPQKTILNAVSGKGKSTFVNIINGIRTDFTGELFIDDKSTKNFTLNDWSNYRSTKIATVYQDLQLLLNFTVWQNIKVKNQLTNCFNDDELNEMLEALNIINLKNKICKNLSLGQQQRVAIVRAVCQPFKLLVLDEPFSHLDSINEQKVWSLLQKLMLKNNAGLIITTLENKPNIEIDSELKI